MLTIRPIEPTEVGDLILIQRDAYPSVPMPEPDKWAARVLKDIMEPGDVLWCGAFEDGELIGGLRVHAFDMCCFGERVGCGGLGGVAVSLSHKQRGVARDMIGWYVEHCERRGDVVLALYPFRQDFYRAMGWGLGAPLLRYRVVPEAFPGSDASVRRLTADDREQVATLFRGHAARTHGMFQPTNSRLDAVVTPSSVRSVGYFEDGRLTGTLCFDFESCAERDILRHNLVVRHWCHATPAALGALLGFLRKQSDQVRRVEITSHDPWFHHLLSNSESDADHFFQNHRQVAVSGLGTMWRLVDTARFFAALPEKDWGGVNLSLGIQTSGALGQTGPVRCAVRFDGGRAELLGADAETDVELDLLTADFASLALGVIPLRRLLANGQARLSDPARADLVGRVFHAEQPPICDTQF